MRRAAIVFALLGLAACQRERRDLRVRPPDRESLLTVSTSQLVPGGAVAPPALTNPYQGNAWAISEGQRLFTWYNCIGCHANGGGGIGPALNDNNWIYGGEPAQIFDTILAGRPNGMPTWRGKIPEYQVWQLVAYVRSLSNQQPRSATPARSDHIEINPAQPSGTARNP